MSSDPGASYIVASMEDVWRSLKYHSKGKSLIETINRLWKKNQLMWGVPNAEEFQLQQLTAVREEHSATELFGLLHPAQVTEVLPEAMDYDIVAIRSGEHTYIIDGRRRINECNRGDGSSMLNVLVVATK